MIRQLLTRWLSAESPRAYLVDVSDDQRRRIEGFKVPEQCRGDDLA